MSSRRKISDEELANAVVSSSSMAEVLRKLGFKSAGGTQSHYTSRVKKAGIDTSHFVLPSSKGKPSPARKNAEDILVKRDTGFRAKPRHLKRALIESGVEYKCNKCGIFPEWLGNPLTLDVDHINEDWLDDSKENLRFLCPNCHSQFSRGLIPQT